MDGIARKIGVLMIFLGVVFGISFLGGIITQDSVGTWYQTLNKPDFNPPDWLFAPVWIILFFMMGMAAWLVWLKKGFGESKLAMSLFVIQLALNLTWSYLFFGLRNPSYALAEIIPLLVAILATADAFRRISLAAGILMLPYAAWVSFAILLNYEIVMLN
jgi:tryptophan-rich sensory protein